MFPTELFDAVVDDVIVFQIVIFGFLPVQRRFLQRQWVHRHLVSGYFPFACHLPGPSPASQVIVMPIGFFIATERFVVDLSGAGHVISTGFKVLIEGSDLAGFFFPPIDVVAVNSRRRTAHAGHQGGTRRIADGDAQWAL